MLLFCSLCGTVVEPIATAGLAKCPWCGLELCESAVETTVQPTPSLNDGKPVTDHTPRSEPVAPGTLAYFSAPADDTSATVAAAADAGASAAGAGTLPCSFGDYELLTELGHGGMGVVYRALQRSANRLVAVKLIRADLLADSSDDRGLALARFRLEAQSAAQLDHEHVVTVYDVGELNGCPFYTMKYVDGRSLYDLLCEGPLENRRAAGYMESVARGVHEAHQLGILHRDLKPRNILIEAKNDRALVTDFGLAKLTGADNSMTVTGVPIGTPPYMSPEQAVDSSRVTTLSDVYSLGATLYHALTGRPPFQASTPLETLDHVVHQTPMPPRQLNPAVARDLETICLTAINKEPPDRYATAAELADDLRRWLRGEPILRRPLGLVERCWRWCRRVERMRDAGISSLVLGAVLLIWSSFGLLTLVIGIIKPDRPWEAQLTVGMDLFISIISLWAGCGALAKRQIPLWIGLLTALFFLAFSLACLVGLPFDGGGLMTDVVVRLTLFSLLAVLMMAAVVINVVALVAYYSKRT